MKFENGNNEINLMPNGTRWVDMSEIKHVMTSKKQGYSEEEVLELLITCKNKFGGSGLEDYTCDDEVKEWFEQFKNK